MLTVHPVLDLEGLKLLRAVEEPAYAADFVALPADPIEEKLPGLGGKEIAGQRHFQHVALRDGEPVGTVGLDVPTRDNLTAVTVDIIVHPAQRRQGIGRQLTAWALEEAARLGRSRIWFSAHSPLDGRGPGEPLLRQIGAKPGLVECRRLLDLASVELLPKSDVAEGYRIEQWTDEGAPDHLVDGVAYLEGRMSTDAPSGEINLEPEVWDAARVREKEAHGRESGRLHLVTVTVHEATGAVAGLTEIAVSRSRPDVAYQWETIVDPLHRGHRLGLALKTWNHQLLVERSPGTRYVNTWNADSNTFMVSVNEQCGFRLAERWTQWELDL